MSVSDLNGEARSAAQRALYDETGRVATVFWEWRHKIILLALAEITLALAGATWMYREHLGGIAMAIPLAIAVPLVAACSVFDRRNVQILDNCFAVNALLEREFARAASTSPVVGEELGPVPIPEGGSADAIIDSGGIYTLMKRGHDSRVAGQALAAEASAMSRISSLRATRDAMTYTSVLEWIYLGMAFTLLLCATACAILGVVEPSLLKPDG